MKRATTDAIGMPQRLFRDREVAQALGLSVTLIKRLRATGRLKFVRINSAIRTPAEEIERLIEEGAA